MGTPVSFRATVSGRAVSRRGTSWLIGRRGRRAEVAQLASDRPSRGNRQQVLKICQGSHVAMTAAAGRSPALVSTASARPSRSVIPVDWAAEMDLDLAEREARREGLHQN